MDKVSIIIPCREVDSLTKKCVKHCLDLDYKTFEIIVLPDSYNNELGNDRKIKVVETGSVKPAEKRNKGMEVSKGKFFAFIDSDAFPERDWLKNAVKYFEDEKIGIVGGPNLTPDEANFWERVSGYILENFWVSGKGAIRYKVSKNQFTHELPTCNFLSRREASSNFDSKFLTAEDSDFCFKCIGKGYKILYAGDVIVKHHRRDSFGKHLKQIWIYARDIAWLTKGNFSKKDLYYSLLSFFSVGFFAGIILSWFSFWFRIVFLEFLFVYLIIIGFMSMHDDLKTSFWVFVGSVLTHFTYGFGYVYGMFSGQKLEQFSER